MKSVFKVNEYQESEKGMLDLAKMLKDSGNWIDPNLFALKCCDCGAPL